MTDGSEDVRLFRRPDSPYWWMRVSRKEGARGRISTKCRSIEEARAFRDRFVAERTMENALVTDGWRRRVLAAADDSQSWLRQMHGSALGRTRARGEAPSLTFKALLAAVMRTAGRCQVSGVPFSWNEDGTPSRDAFSISLDRPDVSRPYAVDNIRLVCRSVNYAMHTWGEGPFRWLCRQVVARELLLSGATDLARDPRRHS